MYTDICLLLLTAICYLLQNYIKNKQHQSLRHKKRTRLFYKSCPLLFPWRASCRIRTNDPEITNDVLWPTELKRRVGKLLISRRYNQLPLLRSRPGGFEGSWPYKTYPCLFKSECKGSGLIWYRQILSKEILML